MPDSFDPDAFLREEPKAAPFDPDAFLSEKPESGFDPDEFLGTKETPAPRRRSYARELADTLQKSNLFTSATGAAEGAWDKTISRKPTGEWDLPLMAPLKPADGILDSAVNTIGGMATTLGQKLGARMDLAGPAVDTAAVQNTFNEFQKANGLSDDEVKTAWQDFGNINRTWEEDEKVRVLSDGTVFPNPGSSVWLDKDQAEKAIASAPTSEEAKQAMRDKLPDIRNAIASNKLEAYEAASDVVNKAVAAQSIGNPRMSRLVAGRFTPPTEWAKQQGRTDLGTPEFVRDYEKSVVDAAPWVRQKLWGLSGKLVTGWGQVANTVLGLGGLAGSDTMSKMAGEGSQAQQTINQGLPNTGVLGSVVEQTPSLIAQMGPARLLGLLGSKTLTTLGTYGMAGAQSAGMTYADLISQGVDEKTAREKAVRTGVSTAVITSLFGTGSAGGVESAIAGKEIGEVTMRELADIARQQGVKNFATSPQFREFVGTVLKEAGGEAAEEGIDQFAQAFLLADPDTSVADAWTQAKEAAFVGGAMGSGVQLAMKAMPYAPESARAAMEPVTPESAATAPLTNEAPTENPPLELPVPPVPIDQSGTEGASAAPVSETRLPPADGTTGPETPAPLTNETEIPDPPVRVAPTAPVAETPQEDLPEGMPETGVQPPPSGPAVPAKERDPAKVKMVVRILARQGVDPDTAREIAGDLIDDVGETANAEDFREKAVNAFRQRGGVMPNESAIYSEDAASYEASGDTPEEAAQKVENAKAFNALQRSQADDTNRGLVGQKKPAAPEGLPESPAPVKTTPSRKTIYDMSDDEILAKEIEVQQVANQSAVEATDESGPGSARDLADTASEALAAIRAEIDKRKKAGKFSPSVNEPTPTTTTPVAETPQEDLPPGVPETGVQPPPSGPAVAGSEILGTPRPGFTDQFVTPEGATIELLPDGKASFIVPPDQRGRGAGNAAVERVKQYADTTGTTIQLDIEPLGNEPGMSRAELADWYERRGFTVSEDRLSAEYEPSPAPTETVVGEMNDFQKAAQAVADKEYDPRSPEFFIYDDTFQVDPSRLPDGAKYFPEEGEAQYYVPQRDGSWNLVWKDLEGSTRVSKNTPPPTQPPNEPNTQRPEVAPPQAAQPAPVEAGAEKIYHGTGSEPGLGQRSGYYPGTYTSTSEGKASEFGGNIFSTSVDPAKIFNLSDAEALKTEARDAGFEVRNASGNGEVEFLKSQGYYGMRRGSEVILFDNFDLQQLTSQTQALVEARAPGGVAPGAGGTGAEATAETEVTIEGQIGKAKPLWKRLASLLEKTDPNNNRGETYPSLDTDPELFSSASRNVAELFESGNFTDEEKINFNKAMVVANNLRNFPDTSGKMLEDERSNIFKLAQQYKSMPLAELTLEDVEDLITRAELNNYSRETQETVNAAKQEAKALLGVLESMGQPIFTNKARYLETQPTQSPNEPNPQRLQSPPPEAAQPAPAEAGAPGGVAPGAGGTGAETPTEPRLKLLSELGTPTNPGFPDKVTTPEGAVLELTAEGGKIKASVTVPPENRRKGAGTAAMQRLVDLARRDGVTLDLDVQPLGNTPAMSKEELTSWYAGLGFTDNGDGTMTLSPEKPVDVASQPATNPSSGSSRPEGYPSLSPSTGGKTSPAVAESEVQFLPGQLYRDSRAKSEADATEAILATKGKFTKADGSSVVITPSSKKGAILQVTYFDPSGNPISDTVLTEADDVDAFLAEVSPDVAEYAMRKDLREAGVLGGINLTLPQRSKPVAYQYRLKYRDVGPASQPEGFISSEGRNVEYDRPLTDQELADFEIEPTGARLLTPEFGNPPVDPNTPEPLGPNPPTPEPPNFENALEDDSVTGLYHAQTDADRARLGLPPRFKQPRTTDQEAWDRATAAEDAHRAAGDPGTAGTDLLTNLLNDVPRVLTKNEHALLLHEKLVREQAVEAAQSKLNSLPVGTPDGVRKDAQAAVKSAQDAFDLLVTYADAAGSRAGLSLQARKMLVNMDFSLASVVNRLKAAANMKSDAPVKWTEKDQKAAVEIAEKLQQAQERVDALEAENSEQVALIEQLTKDVEWAQTKLENRMRTSRARTLVKEKLDPLVEAAKARMAERHKAPPTDENAPLYGLIGPTPEMVEDLKDIAIISAGWVADKALTLQEFSSRLVAEFGDWVAEHAQSIFRQARSLYIETAESVSGGNAPTPESVVKDIDPAEPLDKTDVWALARAHVVAGKRGRNVLDAVFGDLSSVFPNLTRDEVAEAFTGYGTVVYPSTKAVPAELRRIRSLEREYLKQADIRAGQMPKRTGYQGDAKKGPEWAEVRAEQQRTADALRELENQLREAGLPVPSDERKLANALNTKKRRLTNEIEEIELALKSKTPRTPKSRTPIADDAEVRDLEKRLAEKRAEYEEVFKDESAREKRILGSLKKRRMELERRINEKDFSRPEVKPPVNTEAKRKAEYEFAKVRAKFEEMRHKYILENAPLPKKVGHYVMSGGNLLKILTLGGDIGVVMRQLGTTYQAITRDLGMLAPTKEGAKRREDGSYLKRIISEGVKSFGSAEYEHTAYERLMERQNAGWDKTAGLVLSAPFDIQRNSKEDIPAANLLDKIPWWMWPALAGLKVSLLGTSFPVSASILALGAVTKPFMQALDRAQRTMTNQSRAMFFDAALAALHDGNPTVQEAKAIAKAVMVGTGRGTATQKIESAIPFANQVILATRYYISRIQALTLYPLLNKDARASRDAQREISRMYARSVAGRAVLYGLAAMAFGKALTGDDDDPEEGLIIDPRNPNFGRVKLANGVSLDFMSGLNNFASAAARYFGKVKVDPTTGKKEVLGPGFTNNVNDEALRFLRSKLNIQFSFLVNTHAGEYFGGKPVNLPNALEEITTAIIVNDTFNTYKAMMEEYGPTVGAARASLFLGMMFGGAGTSVLDSEAEKEANRIAKKEADMNRKMIEAEINE